MTASWEIRQGDALERLREMPSGSVQTCVTSPPYFGLRDYGDTTQIGLEPTPDEYVARLVGVFREVRRVLRDDGTLWLNLGDSFHGGGYSNHRINGEEWLEAHGGDHRRSRQQDRINANPNLKPKDLLGIPWMVAFALRADGWYLRSDIVWSKPNPMPESVTDRPTKAHEYVFLLSKGPRYFYDADAIREEGVSLEQTAHNERYAKEYEAHTLRAQAGEGIQPGSVGNQGIHSCPGPGGRNKRSVWTVSTMPFPGAHFAVFPPKLIEPCILAGSSDRACGVCGAPWERVTEAGEVQSTGGSKTGARASNMAAVSPLGQDPERGAFNTGEFVQRERVTVGWQPCCSHHDDTGASTVLDPFAGAGTAGLVALRHGRSFVGIELNPGYIELARHRILDDEPLWNWQREVAA